MNIYNKIIIKIKYGKAEKTKAKKEKANKREAE